MANIGSLKNTGFITLETSKNDWEKFADQQEMIQYKTTALLDFYEGNENKKGRVNLIINSILSPKKLVNKSMVSLEGPISKKVSLGMIRSKKHLIDSLDEKTWVFFGNIQGAKVETTHLLIMYYESINIYTYAIKPKDEEVVAFYGENSFNPQNN